LENKFIQYVLNKMQDNKKSITKEKKVICYGREQQMDHPKVYLQIKEGERSVTCPYCSCEFTLEV